MIFARNNGQTVPEQIREPAMREALSDLVDRIPRRTAKELQDDLRGLAIEAAEAYDTGQYSLAERTLVRLAYTISSHYRDTGARNVFAALKFVQRGEKPIKHSTAGREAL